MNKRKEVMNEQDKFRKLGLTDKTLTALQKKGFEEPTSIQEKIIPAFLSGEKDLIGQAQTGTGKTAAFGLPILEMLDEGSKNIEALILTPTRELAIQVAEELNSLKGNLPFKIIPVYGGQNIAQQIKKIKKRVSIVVGTPGRIKDHIKRKTINLKSVSYVILDEADEMLNMGFIEDVEDILESAGKNRRMLMFSATMPARIKKIAEKFMGNYEHITVKKEQLVTGLTEQIYFEVNEQDKLEALTRIIDIEDDFYGLVFCRTKIIVSQLAGKLIDRGYEAEALHGDITQPQREVILGRFRKRKINILVATDVAARGIDIINLTHVINYSLPQDPESYIHRIGRTGRAGSEGMAITFVTPQEYRKLTFIKKVAKTDIRKEQIPEISDVIRAKRERIFSEIDSITSSGDYAVFNDMAQELLSAGSPENVLASVLFYAFREELDENSYKPIRDVFVDKKGKARLFISIGRKDNFTKRKLVNTVEKISGINERFIKGAEVYDTFSFITVPFSDAETIIRAFKKRGRGTHAEIAKNPKKKGRRRK
jgi:ATP-dependent RNA helicase DeaD